MSLDKIYYELSRCMDDEYYVELAGKNALLVPVLVDFIEDKKKFSHGSEALLEKISEKYPLTVYPHFAHIFDIISGNSDLFSIRAWKIIVNLLSVDYLDFWSGAREKFYSQLGCDNIAWFSLLCDCAEKVAASKPQEKEHMIELLSSTQNRTFTVEGEPSETCKEIAIEKAAVVLHNLCG